MQLDFGSKKFAVIVTLDVLSHVADQPAFIAKLASHLRVGGQLMLATQNKPILQKYNRVPPPSAGQLRRTVLAPIKGLRYNGAVFRDTQSQQGYHKNTAFPNPYRPIRALIGRRLDGLKESIGLGWTLTSLAKNQYYTAACSQQRDDMYWSCLVEFASDRTNSAFAIAAGLLVQDLAEEQFRALVLRVVEECCRLVLLHDLPLIHEDHAVCHLTGKAHLVRDANHRHAFFG
jgi:hypothetical protein